MTATDRPSSNELRWLTNGQQVAEFYAEHGRFPARSETGGQWLVNQRQAAKGNGSHAWTPERQTWMDANLLGWQEGMYGGKSRADAWLARAQEVIDFRAEHGRFPTQSERGGEWLAKQRQAAKGNGHYAWTPERQTWMDENIPGWTEVTRLGKLQEEVWLVRAQEVLDFRAEHGRFPTQSEAGGQWLATQRQAAKGNKHYAWAPERQAWMDENLPGWADVTSGGKPQDDVWLAQGQQVAEFYAEHGRFPTKSETGGRWLGLQRQTARGQLPVRWTTERQTWMDENLPGWLKTGRKRGVKTGSRPNNDKWLGQAQAVAEFRSEHGRLPVDDEPGAKWLENQRGAANGRGSVAWTTEREAWMGENLPGWLISESQSEKPGMWRSAARAVVRFYKENGRLPSKDEPNGAWLTQQRHATPERQAWLDQRLPEWGSSRSGRQPNNETWMANAAVVVSFRAEHGRMPKSFEPGGNWLAMQRTALRGQCYGWTPERERWMDENLTGWRTAVRRRTVRTTPRPTTDAAGRAAEQDAAWLRQATEVAEFRASHGRFPGMKELGGTWLNNQRAIGRGWGGRVMQPQRQTWMDENLPGWLTPGRRIAA